jgi:hypothetical protein
MAATNFDGPLFSYGNMAAMYAPPYGTPAEPDPNLNAGPCGLFQGYALLDPRITFPKDKVTGYTGVIPAFIPIQLMRTYDGIPFALAAANIAAAQNVTSGTAMTLASASTGGVTVNIPVRVFAPWLNANMPIIAPVALDFGFDFGTTTTGASATTVTVTASNAYTIGMPLVIAGAGNSAGTAALLTIVTGTPTATTITIANPALSAITATPIGTGDLWGPSEVGFPTPQAAYPFVAAGPGMFLDDRQALMRQIRIVGSASAAGGAFKVTMMDVYGQVLTETITVAAGASTSYGLKTGKYVISVVPQFTDAHNYSVGTSDVFSFAFRSKRWENTLVFWAGAQMTSATGWTAWDGTNPPTLTSGDVRGTIQTGTGGAGTGIGSTASNGALSGLVLTGNRLVLSNEVNANGLISAGVQSNFSMFGYPQT